MNRGPGTAGATLAVAPERIERRILWIRGQKVMLDADLAVLYGTTTKALNQAVKRNVDRFPGDFMFRLNRREKHEVVTNCDHLRRLKRSHHLLTHAIRQKYHAWVFRCPHCGAAIKDKLIVAHAGRIGGKKTAARGPDYFKWLQSLRKKRRGGRPRGKSHS